MMDQNHLSSTSQVRSDAQGTCKRLHIHVNLCEYLCQVCPLQEDCDWIRPESFAKNFHDLVAIQESRRKHFLSYIRLPFFFLFCPISLLPIKSHSNDILVYQKSLQLSRVR